jgi:hypothetical protein
VRFFGNRREQSTRICHLLCLDAAARLNADSLLPFHIQSIRIHREYLDCVIFPQLSWAKIDTADAFLCDLSSIGARTMPTSNNRERIVNKLYGHVYQMYKEDTHSELALSELTTLLKDELGSDSRVYREKNVVSMLATTPYGTDCCACRTHARVHVDSLNRNRLPTASSSTATCRYVDVMLTFACPAASRTSASVRLPASAWLMKVCRP